MPSLLLLLPLLLLLLARVESGDEEEGEDFFWFTCESMDDGDCGGWVVSVRRSAEACDAASAM